MSSTHSYKSQIVHLNSDLTFLQMGLLEGILQAEVENIITGGQNTNDIQELEDMAAKLGFRLDTTIESIAA